MSKEDKEDKYSEKLKGVNIRMKAPEEMTREERAEFKKEERSNRAFIGAVCAIAFIVFAIVMYFVGPWSWQEFFESILP